MQHRTRKRGQSTAEYLVVLALVLAAVTAMQVFGERALKGKMYGAWNKFPNVGSTGDGANFLTNQRQYEPYYVNENQNITQNQNVKTDILIGGRVNRVVNATTTRTGSSNTLGAGNLNDDNAWK